MNVSNITDSTIGKILNMGSGWAFAAAMLYLGYVGIFVEVPKYADRVLEQQARQGLRFTEEVKQIADSLRQTASIREATINKILEELHSDEAEERRLMVELLRRSDLTADELSDAIEASTDPP